MPPATPILTYEGMIDEQPATPGIETLAKESIDKCIEALCEVVRQVLQSKSPSKFTEVERLCRIGHNLVKTKASTVDEFLALGGQIHDDRNGRMLTAGGVARGPQIAAQGYGYGGHVAQFVGGAYNVGAVGTANGVLIGADVNAVGVYDPAPRTAEERHRRLDQLPKQQVGVELAAAEIANAEAEELERLVAVRDKLPEEKRKPIDERINALIASVEVRNHALAQRTDRPEPPAPPPIPALPVYEPDVESRRAHLVEIPGIAVVSTDVLRGHPAHEEGRQDNAPPGVRADGRGGEGARHPPQAGDDGADFLQLAMG